ncbi:hypothetical protein B0H14DRAFT_2733418 [Mycena olivaceomarginata]|nr:hypothetical protein B0H14DRAFT_2733418 [Mycena olivaceomarginata]
MSSNGEYTSLQARRVLKLLAARREGEGESDTPPGGDTGAVVVEFPGACSWTASTVVARGASLRHRTTTKQPRSSMFWGSTSGLHPQYTATSPPPPPPPPPTPPPTPKSAATNPNLAPTADPRRHPRRVASRAGYRQRAPGRPRCLDVSRDLVEKNTV